MPVGPRLTFALAALSIGFNTACAAPPDKPGGVYPSRPVRLVVPHAPGEPTGNDPEAFQAFVASEISKWQRNAK